MSPPVAAPTRSSRRNWRWPGVVGLVLAIVALVLWLSLRQPIGVPIELPPDRAEATFIRSVGPLLDAELTAGNRTELLANGDRFFPAMLEAIASAKHSITFENYIWSSGEISDRFIAALTERARHGVKVHVIVDGVGAFNFSDADQRRLLDGGVEFAMYRRERWYHVKLNLNHRTHRKILVVDGRVGFTGGMCVDDRWLGDADRPDRWRETQIRLEGPVVRQMQSAFVSNWLKTTSRLLVGPEYFPSLEATTGPSLVQCYQSGPADHPHNAVISYLLAIAAARKSILISHAYFVPDDLAIDMLVAARQRGVRVQVVLPATNDSAFGRAASRSRWGRLLEAGVEFHLFTPAMYHCKVMVVDDYFVTIGSVNFDNRSFSLNDELNVNVFDPRLVVAATAMFSDDLARSRRYTLEEHRSRPWWLKQADRFCGLFQPLL